MAIASEVLLESSKFKPSTLEVYTCTCRTASKQRENCAVPNKKLFLSIVCHMSLSDVSACTSVVLVNYN